MASQLRHHNSLSTCLTVCLLLIACLRYTLSQTPVCSKKSDIVFVIDQSGSIVENGQSQNWVLVQNFMKKIVDSVVVSFKDTQIGYVTFGNDGVIRFKLNTYSDANAIKSAIDKVGPGNGQTNLYAGLNAARTVLFTQENGARAYVPHIIIVVTDGLANINKDRTIPEAESCFQAGIKVFAVGVTSLINEPQLQAVSSPPHMKNSNYWTAPDFTYLPAVVSSVLNVTCDNPKTVSPECRMLDFVFAVDVPQTLNNFNILKDFIQQFITGFLPIGPSGVQISVVTYNSNSAQVIFKLNQYTTEDQIKQQISNMAFAPSGNADPIFAFRILNNTIFAPGNGVRGSGIAKVVIFLTDNPIPAANRGATIDAAAAFRNQKIRVYAVGTTGDVSVQDLQVLATVSTYTVTAVDYAYLDQKVAELSTIVCYPGQIPDTICPAIADITLILDESTSIVSAPGGYTNWDTYVLGFSKSIVAAFPVAPNATRFAVVKFSNNARIAFYMDKYTNNADLTKAITALPINGGETNIADAIRQTRNETFQTAHGSRIGIPHLIIMITDGQANVEAQKTMYEANLTKAAGIEIFCIGITNMVDEKQLKAIANYPPETHYFYASDFKRLNTILNDLIAKSCHDLPTIPTTTQTTPSPPTTTTVTTPTTPTTTTSTTTTRTTTTSTTTAPTTTTSTATTSTKATTMPTTTTSTTTSTTSTPMTSSTTTTSTQTSSTSSTTTTARTSTTLSSAVGVITRNPQETGEENADCRKAADVVFIIDKTYNINFNFYRDYVINVFLVQLSAKLLIDLRRTRVALITYNETAVVEFYFNKYSRGLEVQNAYQRISYGGRVADMAPALNLARTDVFTALNGASLQSDVTSLAVVLTSNVSPNTAATIAAADALRNMKPYGVHIVTIGVGTNTDTFQLGAVANYPAQLNSFTVSTATNLNTLIDPVKRLICSDDASCKAQAASCPSCQEFVNRVQCTCPAGKAGEKCDKSCMNGGDVVFVMTTSNRLGQPFIQKMTDFMSNLVRSWDVSSSMDGSTVTRVGLVVYGTDAVVKFQLKDYVQNQEGLLQAINNVQATTGADYLDKAIKIARDNMFTAANGDRSNIPNYIIVMMDGQSDDMNATWREAAAARAAAIDITVVAISPSINYLELAGIASIPIETNIFSAVDTSALTDDWRKKIADAVCHNIDYCANSPCKNGATCRNILGGYTCYPCPAMTTGFNCERLCSGVMDVVFILDSAGSVHRERWHYVLEFVINTVLNLDVHSTRTQVGLIYYSDDAYVGFYLNKYSTRQDVINAVRSIPYLGGRTNAASGFRLARQSVFTSANGDRSDAKNVIVYVANADSTVDQTLTIPEAIENRYKNVTILTVGVEPQMKASKELESITSFPREKNMNFVPSFEALPAYGAKFVDVLCLKNTYCTSNPCQNGGTCVEDLNQYICKCPSGITGVNCQRNCNKKMDIVFILDNSGSVQEEYSQSVAFSRRVVQGLDATNDLCRIGAIAYSDFVIGEFYLNQNIGNQQNTLNSFDFFNKFGTTNTPSALESCLNNQFIAKNGDRPDVQNIVVTVTDGFSNVNANRTIPDAKQLQDMGVTMYAIAVGESPQLSELIGLSSKPMSDHLVSLPTLGDIALTADSLLDKLCK